VLFGQVFNFIRGQSEGKVETETNLQLTIFWGNSRIFLRPYMSIHRHEEFNKINPEIKGTLDLKILHFSPENIASGR